MGNFAGVNSVKPLSLEHPIEPTTEGLLLSLWAGVFMFLLGIKKEKSAGFLRFTEMSNQRLPHNVRLIYPLAGQFPALHFHLYFTDHFAADARRNQFV
jgi:hypothetical protein